MNGNPQDQRETALSPADLVGPQYHTSRPDSVRRAPIHHEYPARKSMGRYRGCDDSQPSPVHSRSVCEGPLIAEPSPRSPRADRWHYREAGTWPRVSRRRWRGQGGGGGGGFAAMDRVGNGPNRRKSSGVRTRGAAGDERWALVAASRARRGSGRSRGCVRGVGDDAVGEEVQALEDGGDHGRVPPSPRLRRAGGDHGDDSTPALASGTGQDVDEEHPGE
jgi:hypothetical protein